MTLQVGWSFKNAVGLEGDTNYGTCRPLRESPQSLESSRGSLVFVTQSLSGLYESGLM